MNDLYDSDRRYTQQAMNINNDISNAIRPIFDKYLAMGYDIRQISHLAQIAVYDTELDTVLDLKPVDNSDKPDLYPDFVK